jgi:hypothetical protein
VELLLDLRVEKFVAGQSPNVAPDIDAARTNALANRFAKGSLEFLDPATLLRPVGLIVAVAVTEEHLLGRHGGSLASADQTVKTREQ